MNRTNRARLIALSVFTLAVASLPLSIALNAPEAQAARISIPASAVAPLPPPPPSSDYVGDNEVWDGGETEASEDARPAPRKTPRAKTTSSKWTCKRIPLVQGGRPGARTVVYCDHL